MAQDATFPLTEPATAQRLRLRATYASLVVTLGLVTYQRHVVRHTGSLAIGADELHYRSDLALNLGVIATLAIGSFFAVPILDPLFGGAVGLWIIYSAAKIARLSLVQLMD